MPVDPQRVQRRLSQEALAKKARISRGYIARLEIGHHDPTVGTLQRLARALGVNVVRLLH